MECDGRETKEAIKDELDIENVVIERAHRVKRNNDNNENNNQTRKPSTAVAKLLHFKDKQDILHESKSLKIRNFYFKEYLSREIVAIRQGLWNEVDRLPEEEGKFAVINYDPILFTYSSAKKLLVSFHMNQELKMNAEYFENLTFYAFNKEDLLLNDSFDPDSNFSNTHGFTNTTYLTREILKAMIKENNDISFSVLHLNIRSLNKSFESLKNLLVEINFCFEVICITESWCSDDPHTNSNYQLPNYVSIHQGRKNGKTGCFIRIVIHKGLIYNIRHGISVNDEDTEVLCLEIINQKSNEIVINTIYRQPSGNKENFENYFCNFYEKIKSRITYVLGDFNLNPLDYDTNCKVKSYCNTIFSHYFIQIINKPTRLTNHNATIIDHNLTSSFYSKIDTRILEVDN